MPIQDHLNLRGVTHFNKDGLTKQLRYGVTEFFKWGFLGIGAFTNVSLDTSGVYGGVRSRLRPVKDPSYTNGKVWEGFRNDWVYETGVAFDTQPIHVSGVYVNGTFHALASTGAYAHYVDYPNGRIVFNSAISTTANVKAAFSYRNVRFIDADQPWFRELMFNSHRIDSSEFLNAASGNWSQHPQNRVSLPSVGIEFVNRRPSKPYELGNTVKIRSQDVLFHIFAENLNDRDQIADILERQDDKTIWIPDRNRIKFETDFPLDYRGSPINNFKTFPQLVADSGDGGYKWRTVTFTNTTVQEMGEINPKLFGAIVRSTLLVLV